MAVKKFFLLFAFICISAIAAGYGFNPPWFAHVFLGVTVLDTDLAHILRAVMGLYFGFGLFWLMSAFHSEHQNTALLTIMFFCGGLLAGRIISIFADGPPAALLQIYAAMEAVLVPITYWVYRLPSDPQQPLAADA